MNTKGRILIIDDNAKNLQVLANILNENNYDIEIGISGLDVFNWLENERFDLLLLDVMMPDISGFEVCKKIRENQQYDLMPIIFISAKTDSDSMVEGFNLGGQDYISKPFDVSELLARVKTHIDLKKSKEELRSLNKDLENKINERTKELHIANQKLTELTNTKGLFLKFISKEISTPLVSVTKVIDVIKQSSESAKMAEMITLLDQSVNKLTRVTQMASYITRIKTNYELSEHKEFSILSAIDYILLNMNDELEKKNLELDVDIDSNLKVNGNNQLFKSSVKAMFSALVQIINNNQLISLYSSIETDNNHFIIESNINDWKNLDSNIKEEISLFTTYSQTIMALDGGRFNLSIEDKQTVQLKWTYKIN